MIACPLCLSTTKFSPNGYGRCECGAIYAWASPPAHSPVWHWRDQNGITWRIEKERLEKNEYGGWSALPSERRAAVAYDWAEVAAAAHVLLT